MKKMQIAAKSKWCKCRYRCKINNMMRRKNRQHFFLWLSSFLLYAAQHSYPPLSDALLAMLNPPPFCSSLRFQARWLFWRLTFLLYAAQHSYPPLSDALLAMLNPPPFCSSLRFQARWLFWRLTGRFRSQNIPSACACNPIVEL